MNIESLLRRFFASQIIVIVLIALLGGAYLRHYFQRTFGLSHAEEVALIILLITAILWIFEVLPLYITSLGVLLLQVLWLLPILQQNGSDTTREAFYLAFFSDITLLFMGGFVLSSLLNKYGLARRMATIVLRRTGSAPANVLMGIIVVSSLLSMWMSNTATAAMMFAVVTPILSKLPDTEPFSKGLAIAIPFACNLGGLGTPIGTPPNAIAMEYLQQININVSFVDWMLISFPIMLLLLFFLWRILLRMFPPGDITVQMETDEDEASGWREYLVLAIFALTVLGWLFSGAIGISTGTVGLMVVIVCFGLNLLDTRDFRNISWDILFMLGGGLCLGVGLNASGLTQTIAGAIPVENSFWLAFAIMVLLAALMTTFMSNTATANLLIPVAVSLPQSELLMAIAIAIMCSSSMALPVSTPPNAVAFGSGLLRAKDMMTTGSWITLIALAATFIAALFYFPLFL